MSNLIEERDERTRARKKKKRKMDSIIGLGLIKDGDEIKNTLKMSASVSDLSDKSIRLLDEGYCDQGFVIKKGTMKKFLDGENQFVCGWEMDENGEWQKTKVLNLTDDFKGTVNVGHQEFATYPIIVGEWTRKDLSLIDIENERKGLDVALHINEDLNVVQDLKAMPYDIGVSAEFYYHINDADTEALLEALGEYIPVIDEIFIFAYGLVGECGNVNSSGLELKGAIMKKPNMEQMALDIDANVGVGEEPAPAEDTVVEPADDTADDAADDVTEDEGDEGTNEAEPDEAALDAEPADVAEDDAEGEPSDDDVSEDAPAEDGEHDADKADDDESNEDGIENADGEKDEVDDAELSFEKLVEKLAALTAEVARLKDIEAKYVTLKKNHRRVNRKLAEEKEAKAEFFAKTKSLSIELFENEGEAEKEAEEEAKKLASERKYYKGDGIAD